MDVKVFWSKLIGGFVVLALLYGGLFWLNYSHFSNNGGWEENEVACTVIGGVISMLWCCNLFWWIYCVVTEQIKKFIIFTVVFYIVLFGMMEMVKRLV